MQNNESGKMNMVYSPQLKEVVLEFDVGKRWIRGYKGPHRPGMLKNMATDNGTKRFDWRLFFRNLADSGHWNLFNPNLGTQEQLQARIKAHRKRWELVSLWAERARQQP